MLAFLPLASRQRNARRAEAEIKAAAAGSQNIGLVYGDVTEPEAPSDAVATCDLGAARGRPRRLIKNPALVCVAKPASMPLARTRDDGTCQR